MAIRINALVNAALIVPVIAIPATAQVVDMEAIGTSTCQYLSAGLVCNISANQTFANGREVSGLYAFNCQTAMMAVKDPVAHRNEAIEQRVSGWTEAWSADTPAELNFVGEQCQNFETISGGSDGLLADRNYHFAWTNDGRLTCLSIADSDLHPLKRCFDAAGITSR